MLEATVTIVIAAIAGGAALNNRLHNRINNVHDVLAGWIAVLMRLNLV